MSVVRSTVRWNRDLDAFELRCDDCAAKGNVAAYWPLSREFWDIHSMRRCRSCNAELDRKRHKERRRLVPEAREHSVEYVRAWRKRNPNYNAEYAAIQRRVNPDRKQQNNRSYYERNRERILEKNRAYKRRMRAA